MSDLRPAELHEEVRRHLALREVRYTSGRRSVVASMARLNGPESASELHSRMDVPLSSLYRSLTVLADSGVLQRHHDADGLARFELAEWLAGHHHHLVCIQCGGVEDFEAGPAEAALEELAQAVAGEAGYEVTGHNLEIEGLCRDCRR